MATTATTKKITVATVKAFIRKNRQNLLVDVRSSFDGMQDMVSENKQRGWKAAEAATQYDFNSGKYVPVSETSEHSLGLQGVYFVGGGRDSCRAIEVDGVKGFEVYNCCGTWRVGVQG